MKHHLEIHSDIFHLRPLRVSDLQEIHAIWTDAHVRKYLFDDHIISLETTLVEIKKSLQSFEKHRFGLWAVYLHKNWAKMIGFTGFRNFREPPELQLLYGLLPKYCGRGYATALAKIMIHYAFKELHFNEVLASGDAPNYASIGVMKKAGMKFLKRVDVNGLDTVYYKAERRRYPTSTVTYTLRE